MIAYTHTKFTTTPEDSRDVLALGDNTNYSEHQTLEACSSHLGWLLRGLAHRLSLNKYDRLPVTYLDEAQSKSGERSGRCICCYLGLRELLQGSKTKIPCVFPRRLGTRRLRRICYGH